MNNFITKLAQVIEINPDDLNVPQNVPTETTVTDGLQIFFGIAAGVALLVIAICALRMVISRGNAQDVQKSRDAIIYASIGLAVCIAGLAIVTFVIEKVST